MKEKEYEKLHIHISPVKTSFYVLFLLIPSLVFVGSFFLIFRRSPDKSAAKVEKNLILGEEMRKTITISGKRIEVELADTEVKRRQGLSNIQSLGENQGMLFVFGKENIQPPFWMKDMLMSIDIIWINDDKVTQIDKNVADPSLGTPDSKLTLYIASEPVDYVLELNAGFSDKNNIQIGDSVDLREAL